MSIYLITRTSKNDFICQQFRRIMPRDKMYSLTMFSGKYDDLHDEGKSNPSLAMFIGDCDHHGDGVMAGPFIVPKEKGKESDYLTELNPDFGGFYGSGRAYWGYLLGLVPFVKNPGESVLVVLASGDCPVEDIRDVMHQAQNLSGFVADRSFIGDAVAEELRNFIEAEQSKLIVLKGSMISEAGAIMVAEGIGKVRQKKMLISLEKITTTAGGQNELETRLNETRKNSGICVKSQWISSVPPERISAWCPRGLMGLSAVLGDFHAPTTSGYNPGDAIFYLASLEEEGKERGLTSPSRELKPLSMFRLMYDGNVTVGQPLSMTEDGEVRGGKLFGISFAGSANARLVRDHSESERYLSGLSDVKLEIVTIGDKKMPLSQPMLLVEGKNEVKDLAKIVEDQPHAKYGTVIIRDCLIDDQVAKAIKPLFDSRTFSFLILQDVRITEEAAKIIADCVSQRSSVNVVVSHVITTAEGKNAFAARMICDGSVTDEDIVKVVDKSQLVSDGVSSSCGASSSSRSEDQGSSEHREHESENRAEDENHFPSCRL